MGKRKRGIQEHGDGGEPAAGRADKHADGEGDGDAEAGDEDKRREMVQQGVLAFYYPRLLSLRTYLLELLPASSVSRQRRVRSVGREKTKQESKEDGDDERVARLLDSTIVGVLKPASPAINSARQRELAAFTQSQVRSSALRGTDVGATSDIADVCYIPILIHVCADEIGGQLCYIQPVQRRWTSVSHPLPWIPACGRADG